MMEMNYLDVCSLRSHLISRNLISHRVYQLGHMGACLLTGVFCASSFLAVISVCVGDRDGDLMFGYLIKSRQSSCRGSRVQRLV